MLVKMTLVVVFERLLKQEVDRAHMEFLTESHFLEGKKGGQGKRPTAAAFTDRGVARQQGETEIVYS